MGRTEPLNALLGALEHVARGSSTAVLIGGDAGMGKSFLVAEAVRRARERGAQAVLGNCLRLGDGGLPYAPFVEALTTLAGVIGTDALRRLGGPNGAALGRLLPGIDLDPDPNPNTSDKTILYEVVLAVLERLAEQAPLVLVVEDLHWAAVSTQDLLAFLVHRLRGRVLVLATLRNDEVGPSDPLTTLLAELGRRPNVERMEVSPFGRTELYEQLRSLLGRRPTPDLLDDVLRRSDGNPLFVEELVASHTSGEAEFRSSLQEIVVGRLNDLSPEARRVASVAAVAGRPIGERVLADVAGLEGQQLDAALRETIEGRFITIVADRSQYAVRHALVREAVYAHLLAGERRRLHAEMARTLQGSGGDRSTAELARHLDAAGDHAGALVASLAAARGAEAVYAFGDAHRHYARALELWEQVEGASSTTQLDRLTLLMLAGEAAHNAGRADAAVALVEAALQLVDPDREPECAAAILERLASVRWPAGDTEGSLAAGEEALRLLPANPTVARARMQAAVARSLMLAARYPPARVTAQQAIATARAVGGRREEGLALNVVGVATSRMGDPAGGLAHLYGALALAKDVGEPDDLVRAYINTAAILSEAGRQEESVELNLEGAAFARERGLSVSEALLLVNAASVLLDVGRWPEAEPLLRDACLRAPPGVPELRAETVWGTLLLRRGELAAAKEHLQNALDLSTAMDALTFRQRIWAGLAEIAIWEQRLDDARHLVDTALDVTAKKESDGDVGWIVTLGLRAEADRAELAREARRPSEVEQARRRAGRLIGAKEDFAQRRRNHGFASRPYEPAEDRLCDAELARTNGQPDPAAWRDAVALYNRLRRPDMVAYLRWREAESLLAARSVAAAEDALAQAHDLASSLGAVHLMEALKKLARRARVRLGPAPSHGGEASGDDRFGLTPREQEVLALVAMGRTNRQISENLFMSEKTASVHVSRILAKLSVASRGEAAALAHRLGLIDNS